MALTDSQKSFMLGFYAKAAEICPQYDLHAIGAITAQAMCESNWNRSKLSKNYYNFFGMKCGSSWKGKSVNFSTKEEYTVGTLTTIKDNFRAYDNLEEGVRGYCEFITGYKRYSNLLGVYDDVNYIKLIKADGWATSSTYIKTLTSILTNYVKPICGSGVDYYPAYEGLTDSIVVALRTISVDFSYTHRKLIAAANGISNYKGTAKQNTQLLELLKAGKLIKA